MNIKQQELLDDLNKIICHVDNSYLWRELSGFDLQLRNYFKENNFKENRI